MKTCAIDMHHHYLPPVLVEEAKQHGGTLGIEVGETSDNRATFAIAGAPAYTLQTDLLGVERRLAMMDDGKIAIAALEPHTASLAYGLTGPQGESWCRLYNEGIRDLTNQHPDRFCGLAAVPLQDPERAARVLQHAMQDLALKGGYIGSNVNGHYFIDDQLDPFWRKAEELDALLVMHPEDVAGSDRMGPYGMRLICGNPADSALSLGYMTYSGVFDRFPNLKLCVLHGGGFFPYHLGRFDQGFSVRSGSRAAEAKGPPSSYLKNLYFDTLVYRVETLEYLKLMAGAEHLMVGTDYPYTLGDWQAVAKVEAMNCSDAEKLQILEGNARKLLKI